MVRKVERVVNYGVFIAVSLARSVDHLISTNTQSRIIEWPQIESCHHPPKLRVASNVLSNILLLGARRLERAMIQLKKCIVTLADLTVRFS